MVSEKLDGACEIIFVILVAILEDVRGIAAYTKAMQD